MKTIITILISVLCSTFIVAQDFQGIATYKTQIKIDTKDLKLDTASLGMDMVNMIKKQLSKGNQSSHQLIFNRNESVYKSIEQVDMPSTSSGNVQIKMNFSGSGYGGVIYKNLKDKKLLSQEDIMGKQFLVNSPLGSEMWKMTKEKKNIGKYECYKAVSEFEGEVNGKKIKTKKVAWYTQQIPVSNGPDFYGGLPGLILEINDGKRTILCTEIQLNPKKKLTINAPTQGKKISREKFSKIQMQKMKEFMDSKGANGNVIIRSSGF